MPDEPDTTMTGQFETGLEAPPPSPVRRALQVGVGLLLVAVAGTNLVTSAFGPDVDTTAYEYGQGVLAGRGSATLDWVYDRESGYRVCRLGLEGVPLTGSPTESWDRETWLAGCQVGVERVFPD